PAAVARVSAAPTFGSKVLWSASTARSDVYAVRTAGECAIWACRFAGRPVGVDWMIFCRSGRDAAGASSTVWVEIRLIGIIHRGLLNASGARTSYAPWRSVFGSSLACEGD